MLEEQVRSQKAEFEEVILQRKKALELEEKLEKEKK